jgi:hypothetical protein
MNSAIYYNLYRNTSAAATLSTLVHDYWDYFAITSLITSLAMLFLVTFLLALLFLAILIPQIILFPWKWIVSVFFVRKYGDILTRRKLNKTFNFHIDLTRPSQILLLELILFISIMACGLMVVASTLGTSFGSIGQLFVVGSVCALAWKLWAVPWMSYWKIKSHDLLDVGDIVTLGDDPRILLIIGESAAILTYVELDKTHNLINRSVIQPESIPIESIFEKHGRIRHLGFVDSETMDRLKLINSYNVTCLKPTLLNRAFEY